MALDDVVSPEVGIAVAATALVTSPQARNVARRGLVYGLAALIRVGDAAAAAARNVGQSAQQAASATASQARQMATEAQEQAAGPEGENTTPRRPRGRT